MTRMKKKKLNHITKIREKTYGDIAQLDFFLSWLKLSLGKIR